MPQMSPLMWLLLFISTVSALVIIMVKLYFSILYSITSQSNFKINEISNYTWKW